MRDRNPFRRRSKKGAPIIADDEWRPLYQSVLRTLSAHLPWNEELAEVALTVADDSWLTPIAERIVAALDDGEGNHSPTRELSLLLENAREERAFVTRLRAAFPPLFKRTDGAGAVITVEEVLRRVEAGLESSEEQGVPAVATELADAFDLSEEELRVTLTLYAIWELEGVLDALGSQSSRAALKIVSDLADLDVRTFSRITSVGGRLARLCLLNSRGSRDEVLDIEVSNPLMYSLRSGSLDDLSAGVLTETDPPRYRLEEFPVPEEEIRTITGMLRLGRSVLMVGPPGIGKSEFAATVTAAMGRRARKLSMDPSVMETRRAGRESKMRMLMARLAGNLIDRTKELLVVDEADSILQSAVGRFTMFAGWAGSFDKGELNELLEELPVSSIWIANEIDAVPPSAMRRFGHVYEFPRPDLATRTRMLEERLKESRISLPEATARAIAARYELTPSAIDRMASALQSVPPEDVEERAHSYLRSRSVGPLASDFRKLPTPPRSFDPRFSASSVPMGELLAQIRSRRERGKATRLLFDGPPGGGKTHGALYLAREAGIEAVVYRPSDLLSPFVGVAEKNIARMFREAEERGTLLVLDEADALLTDRANARRSWELTQAAEFLQGLQEFGGTLIACTNRLTAIDSALRRRFHQCVTFGPLPPELTEEALWHLFPGVTFAPAHLRELSSGPPLMMSDLANAAELLDLNGPGDRGDPDGDDTSSEAQGARRTYRSPDAERFPDTERVVRAILANAKSRDMSRSIGF